MSLSNKGTTLIEVVIVTFFVTVTLTALTHLTTVTLARNRESRFQSVATRLAQEGIDWLKSERVRLGYNNFSTNFTVGDYCLDDSLGNLDVELGSTVPDTSTCSLTVNGDAYLRWVTVEYAEADYTAVEVFVLPPGRVAGEEISLETRIFQWQR